MPFAVQELLNLSDPDAVLAEDVTFHSPIRSYTGRADVAHLFTTIGQVLTGIEEQHRHVSGARSLAEFTGRAGEDTLNGVFVQVADEQGRLVEATLLLRPFAELRASIMRMAELLEAHPLPSKR
ncbi:nuclear transport factor 2 family protein [Pseudonocardia sp. GCM10023141]|uniref:nuclear transport factor 2 family protein n=1 Tax=Pseudonocardia sp. GCM10023141 TaxID=3252653 RepID=UPI00361E9F04